MATTTRVLTASVNGSVYTTNANDALEAIDTCHSGATAPTDEVANGKLWLDTTTTPGILKIYNNATWEVVLTATGTSQNKLDGIEALADVTDETNVTAAGALMDSEVTNLAQVKAFATTDYATAAQGTTADSALQPTGNGSGLTSLTAGNLTGALPAIDGSALTGLDEFTYTGSAPLFACRAWGKVVSDALVDGGNFASWDGATDTVTFTTAMPHANYAVSMNGPSYGNCWATGFTTTGFTVNQRSSGGNFSNPTNFEFTVVC